MKTNFKDHATQKLRTPMDSVHFLLFFIPVIIKYVNGLISTFYIYLLTLNNLQCLLIRSLMLVLKSLCYLHVRFT